MAKHSKKKKKNLTQKPAALSAAGEKKKPNYGYIALLFINTAVIFGIYRYFLERPFFVYILAAYMVIFASFTLIFVIYNRGFSRKNITPEMLPDSMSDEEKHAFIEDGRRRLKKSRWMITVILPFAITFCLDCFSWFVTDLIEALTGS